MHMSITKSAYTESHHHPNSLYFFAESELNMVAFDLLNWEGSRERIVSAWKFLTSEILRARQQCEDDDEVSQLYDAVEKDVGKATARHTLEVGESGGIDRELNEWFQACITLADNYGFCRWPELALTDYLRGFEGYDEVKARAIAQRAWETARMAYDARKSAGKKPSEKPKKPKKAKKKKAA